MRAGHVVALVLVCVPGAASASEIGTIEMAAGGDVEVTAVLERPLALGPLRVGYGVRADVYLVRLDGLGDPEPVAVLRPAASASAAWQPAAWLAFDAGIAVGAARARVMRECAMTVMRNDTSAALRVRDHAERIDLSVEHAIGATTIGFQIENLFDVAPRDVTALKPDPPLQALVTLSRAL